MRDLKIAARYAATTDLSTSNYYTRNIEYASTPEISKYSMLMNKLKDNNYKLVVIDTRGSKVERTVWMIKRVVKAGMDNFPAAIEAVRSFKPNVRSEYFDVDHNMSLMSNYAIIKY